MQKKADGEKSKKRPVGRPCKKRSSSDVLTNRTVKSTALMTERDDREMMLRWRDEGMQGSYGRWLAAQALSAVALKDEVETLRIVARHPESAPDVVALGDVLTASLGAVLSEAVRRALLQAQGDTTRQIAEAMLSMTREVSDAVTERLLPHVIDAHTEARDARRLVEEALGISKGV